MKGPDLLSLGKAVHDNLMAIGSSDFPLGLQAPVRHQLGHPHGMPRRLRTSRSRKGYASVPDGSGNYQRCGSPRSEDVVCKVRAKRRDQTSGICRTERQGGIKEPSVYLHGLRPLVGHDHGFFRWEVHVVDKRLAGAECLAKPYGRLGLELGGVCLTVLARERNLCHVRHPELWHREVAIEGGFVHGEPRFRARPADGRDIFSRGKSDFRSSTPEPSMKRVKPSGTHERGSKVFDLVRLFDVRVSVEHRVVRNGVSFIKLSDVLGGLLHGLGRSLEHSDLDAERIKQGIALLALEYLKSLPVSEHHSAICKRAGGKAGQLEVLRHAFIGDVMDVREERDARVWVPSSRLNLNVGHGVIPHREERAVRIVRTTSVSVGGLIDPCGVLGLAATEGLIHDIPDSSCFISEQGLEQLGSRDSGPVKSGLIDDVGIEKMDELLEVSSEQLLDVGPLEYLLEPPVLCGDVKGVNEDSALGVPERIALGVVSLDIDLDAEGHEGPVGDRNILAGKSYDAGTLPDLHGVGEKGGVEHVVVHRALPVSLDDVYHTNDSIPFLLGEGSRLLDGFERVGAD